MFLRKISFIFLLYDYETPTGAGSGEERSTSRKEGLSEGSSSNLSRLRFRPKSSLRHSNLCRFFTLNLGRSENGLSRGTASARSAY